MSVSSLAPVWAPCHLPLSVNREGQLRPFQLSSPRTMICVRGAVVDGDGDAMASPVVASWCADERATPLWPFAHLKAAFAVPRVASWRVLEVHDLAPHNERAASRTSIVAALASETTEHVSAARSPPCHTKHRLRLSTVLYAPTWKLLFKRQRSEPAGLSDPPLASSTDGPANEEGESLYAPHADVVASAPLADREALALLFPALHHGCYFTTPQEFAQHCLCSDDHLLWCEDEPLTVVEWDIGEKTAGAAHRSAASGKHSEADIAVAAVPDRGESAEHLSPFRKRRRTWLAQRYQAEKERSPRLFKSRLRRLPDENAPLTRGDCSQTPFAYALELPSELEAALSHQTSSSSDASSPPLSLHDYVVDGDSFASCYALLRAAFRSVFTSLTSSVVLTNAVGRSGTPPRHACEAVAELLLNGIVSSLAQWWSRHGREEELVSSVADTLDVVTLLLRMWWERFAQEVDQAAMARSAALVDSAWLMNFLLQWLTTADSAMCPLPLLSPRGQGGTPQPVFESLHVPPFLAAVSVQCAAAITRQRRHADRARWWGAGLTARSFGCAQESASPGAQRTAPPHDSALNSSQSTVGSVDKHHDTLSSASLCVAAKSGGDGNGQCFLTPEEIRTQREDYRACMDLVMHLLFAEHDEMLTAATA